MHNLIMLNLRSFPPTTGYASLRILYLIYAHSHTHTVIHSAILVLVEMQILYLMLRQRD